MITGSDETKKVPTIDELRCSRYAYFLTYFMVGFPVAYLIFATVIFELDSKGLLSVVLSPLLYLSSFFWIISGVGIRRLRKWSWYTFLIAQFFITYLNALNLVLHSNSEFKVWAFAFTILIQAFVLTAVSKEIRVPYLFPRIRWWESGIAGMPHLPIEFVVPQNQGRVGQILDLNPRGCFIKSPHDFSILDQVTFVVSAFNQTVELSGKVMWNAKSTVTHPKGIGVRFGDLDRKKRRILRVITHHFQKQRNGTS